jgi:hypothetical protein
MTVVVFPRRLPAPPAGYSLWSDLDMDGEPLWFVTLADGDGVIHDEWPFLDPESAHRFLQSKLGGGAL